VLVEAAGTAERGGGPGAGSGSTGLRRCGAAADSGGELQQFAQPRHVAEARFHFDATSEQGFGVVQAVFGQRDKVVAADRDTHLGAVACGGRGAGGDVDQAVRGQPHVEDAVQVADGQADRPFHDVGAPLCFVELSDARRDQVESGTAFVEGGHTFHTARSVGREPGRTRHAGARAGQARKVSLCTRKPGAARRQASAPQ